MRTNINGVIGELTTLPGCSQVVVSHGVYVPKGERGKGLGLEANVARLAYAFGDLGYDYMLCTVRGDNLPQIRIMNKVGWKKLAEFTSSNTGHLILLYGIGVDSLPDDDVVGW